MAKKVISLEFKYVRDTKNFHVYELSGEHEFWPKNVHISKADAKVAPEKITLNIITEDEK